MFSVGTRHIHIKFAFHAAKLASNKPQMCEYRRNARRLVQAQEVTGKRGQASESTSALATLLDEFRQNIWGWDTGSCGVGAPR